MALQTQIVSIPLGKGLDEKSDIKIGSGSSFLTNLNISRPKVEVISRRNTSNYLANSLALAPQQLRSFLNTPAVVAEDLWPLPHLQPYVQGGAAAGDTFQALRPQPILGSNLSFPPPQYASDHFVEPIQGSPLGTTATDSAWTYFTDTSTGAQMIAEMSASVFPGGASALVVRHYPVPVNPQELGPSVLATQFSLGSAITFLRVGAARVAGSNGVILAYMNEGAGVNSLLVKYDPTTLTFTQTTTIPAAANPPTVWDWRFDATGASVFIAQTNGAGTTISVYKVAISSLTLSSTQTIAAATATTALCIAESDLATLTVFWAETTAKTVRCATSTTGAFAAFTIQAGAMNAATGIVTQLTAAERTIPGYSGVTTLGTLWAQSSSGAANYQQQTLVTQYVASTFVQPTGAWSYIFYGAYLASKCFQDRAGALVILAYDSPLQRTYFLAWFGLQAAMNQSPAAAGQLGAFAGKTMYAVAGGAPAVNACLPNFLPIPAASYIARKSGATAVSFAPGGQVAGLRIAGGTPALPTKVGVLMKWLFPSVYGLIDSYVAGASVFSGGALSSYDGGGPLNELGFWIAPEVVSTSASGAAGSVSAGLYGVIGVFATTDAYGNVVRSSAGPPSSVNAAATNTITVVFQSLQFTNRYNLSGNVTLPMGVVTLEIYRTQANSSTYYLDQSSPCYIGSAVTISANLAQPDASLQGNRVLYTTGALNNFSPDGTGVAGVALGRMFCADAYDTEAFHNSQSPVFGVGLNFCAEFVGRLPAGASPGRITAFAGMDDKCIVAKRRGLWYISGDGPTNGGTGGFSPPQLITREVGILNQKAWVLIPAGLLFASEKGVWLLGRDFSLTYVGQDTEDYFAGSPPQDPALLPAAEARAILVETQNQARFIYRGATQIAGQVSKIAVYDYFQKTWDYHGPMASADVTKTFSVVDLLTVGGKTYQAQMATDGTAQTSCVAVERYDFAPEVASNGVITSTMLAQIGWIKYAGTQSAQRFYKLLGLLRTIGTVPADWAIVVQLSYDYDPTVVETHTFTYAQMTAGASQPQFEVQPLRRCQAMLFTLTEVFTTSGSFSFALEDLQVEIAVIGKSARLRAEKKG